jgi:hypothetical protein
MEMTLQFGLWLYERKNNGNSDLNSQPFGSARFSIFLEDAVSYRANQILNFSLFTM